MGLLERMAAERERAERDRDHVVHPDPAIHGHPFGEAACTICHPFPQSPFARRALERRLPAKELR